MMCRLVPLATTPVDVAAGREDGNLTVDFNRFQASETLRMMWEIVEMMAVKQHGERPMMNLDE